MTYTNGFIRAQTSTATSTSMTEQNRYMSCTTPTGATEKENYYGRKTAV